MAESHTPESVPTPESTGSESTGSESTVRQSRWKKFLGAPFRWANSFIETHPKLVVLVVIGVVILWQSGVFGLLLYPYEWLTATVPGAAEVVSLPVFVGVIGVVVAGILLWLKRKEDFDSKLVRSVVYVASLAAIFTSLHYFTSIGVDKTVKLDAPTVASQSSEQSSQSAEQSGSQTVSTDAPQFDAGPLGTLDGNTAAAVFGSDDQLSYFAYVALLDSKGQRGNHPSDWNAARQRYQSWDGTKADANATAVATRRADLLKVINLRIAADNSVKGTDSFGNQTLATLQQAWAAYKGNS